MNSLTFLIETCFGLYLMVVLLRIWLQWARADFYNPFSQFVVKATQPVVAPLRRLIPSLGNLDMATLLFAYALILLKFAALAAVSNGQLAFSPELLFLGLLVLVKEAGTLFLYALIIRAVMSWVSQGRSPIEYVMIQLTEPVIAPVRRVIPNTGGLDLSVLVIFIGIQFLNYLMADLIPYWQLL